MVPANDRRSPWSDRAGGAWEVADGKLDDHFPLVVWQTGSGTQTNMNANEVIANRAIELARRRDRVARSRSTPTTTSTCASRRTTPSRPPCMSPPRARSTTRLIPALRSCASARRQGRGVRDIVKIGRTHLQDATPLTLGQEFSGYVAQLELGVGADRCGAAGPLRAGASAAPRSAPASTPIRISPSASRREIARADRPAVRQRAEQVRGAGRARRAGRGAGRAQRRWPSR